MPAARRSPPVLDDTLPAGATGRLLVICQEPDLRALLAAHRDHAERGSNRTRSAVARAVREFLEGVEGVRAEVRREDGGEGPSLVRPASAADLAAAVAGAREVARGR